MAFHPHLVSCLINYFFSFKETSLMCAYKPKTWQEKLHIDRQPVIEKTEKDFAGIRAGQRMLIPTPVLVDAYIRQIPKGKEVDIATIRKDLALAHRAEVTCPLTTGIFLRIVAEAAYEEYEKGSALHAITPFWRVINERSPAAKKLTFGTAFLKEQRKKEGRSK
jgi:hypothetical protein